MAAVAVGAYCWFRPLPSVRLSTSLIGTTPGEAYALPFPAVGSSAVAVDGLGLVAGHGVDERFSTASLAKVILALCVLEKAPLTPGQQGPTFTLTTSDIEIYNRALSMNASTLGVINGERLTEYQTLQALMIPSADNIADSLARWIFGSHQSYVAYARAWLHAHHLDRTVLGGDASGLHVGTTSTARDLVNLGLIAMRNPVLASIASQRGATFPVVGYKTNYDTVLGQGGITGLKTGNNGSNHGAFLFTSTAQIRGHRVDIAGVILGQPDLATALAAAPAVMDAARRGLRVDTVAIAGQTVGRTVTRWGASTPATAAETLTVLRWIGAPVTVSVDAAGSWLIASTGTSSERVRLIAPEPARPSFWWRLFRR
ncbi:hypothetical protein Back2_04020 [Nocardioides baekrokdamisoli]|uniref:Peptidase S11 D-alanyl-D-alanine carboxypeptidase A N-terminal domain-containing protein n=1 Tax=Nocardioides baekrokdamisoli TaxID=1804624 RepID=A0A3G9IJ78_9ACTN|nr:hypothetical protein Back2_04020 [Nocardioides baekrokdamisoli]